MSKRNVYIHLVATTAATLAFSATPAVTHADAVMDACIEAFVAQRVPKDRPVRVRKFGAASPYYGAPTEQKITLTAKGAKSGTQIASATCIASADGKSVSLQDADVPALMSAAHAARTK